MTKVRVAYNNVFRLLFGYRRSCSASEMFVYNNIYNFEVILSYLSYLILSYIQNF